MARELIPEYLVDLLVFGLKLQYLKTTCLG